MVRWPDRAVAKNRCVWNWTSGGPQSYEFNNDCQTNQTRTKTPRRGKGKVGRLTLLCGFIRDIDTVEKTITVWLWLCGKVFLLVFMSIHCIWFKIKETTFKSNAVLNSGWWRDPFSWTQWKRKQSTVRWYWEKTTRGQEDCRKIPQRSKTSYELEWETETKTRLYWLWCGFWAYERHSVCNGDTRTQRISRFLFPNTSPKPV